MDHLRPKSRFASKTRENGKIGRIGVNAQVLVEKDFDLGPELVLANDTIVRAKLLNMKDAKIIRIV